MTAGGKIKKYGICCPCCGRRASSKKPLNGFGLATLKENEYIYQRCQDCQHKPMTEHEKETLEL
jgi:hypothetical protein